ncbi:SMI1/KNR4 family protein [Pseudobacteroides cellulosolvens]|nr:SMI1/KNR4 family protein [Pseudobacteroides cellulosolvens]
MGNRIFDLTANIEKELPATLERLKEVENLSGLKLPDQYKEYMLTSNG